MVKNAQGMVRGFFRKRGGFLMSNREYIFSLSSEELAKYAYRLVMERVGFSYTGSVQEITN